MECGKNYFTERKRTLHYIHPYTLYVGFTFGDKLRSKRTFKYHMFFCAILDPHPPLDSILTFSANPLPPYTVNRAKGTVD